MTSSSKRLILFDIDGTILSGGKLWRDCFVGALQASYPGVEFRSISFSGKTDGQICAEILRTGGIPEDEIQASWPQVIDRYLDLATEHLPRRRDEIQVFPGVEEVITRLCQEPGVVMGLLTGNVRRGAKLKLGAVGLDHYFDFGVFGDDHMDRYQLPRLAVERAKQDRGLHFSGKEIVIIGDTIHDVNCGKSIGVRSIAVGTGHVDQNELRSHGPDYYFETLADVEQVLDAILG